MTSLGCCYCFVQETNAWQTFGYCWLLAHCNVRKISGQGEKKKEAAKNRTQLEHFPRMPVSSQDRQGLDGTDVSTQKQMWRCYFPREEMWWGLLLTNSPHLTASLDQQLENLEEKKKPKNTDL